MNSTQRQRTGLSLMELLASVTIVAVIAAACVARFAAPNDNAKAAACDVNIGDIELQVQLWRRATGSYPAVNLGTIGANADYFPEGLPTCPVDGNPYTIDAATGRVVGHTH